MNQKMSKRLLCCAALIEPDARVADIGTDHGYLPIWLVQQGIASAVFAADLREKPLEKARANAQAYGVAEQIQFRCSDGLHSFDGSEMDTVVCAGMGGDLIISILEQAPWLQNERYTLILQPQSSGQAVRQYLAAHGFSIQQETLVQEGGFLYAVMRARFGRQMVLSCGEQFLPLCLIKGGRELIPLQLARLTVSLEKTVAGICQCRTGIDQEKLTYFQTALEELKEMKRTYGNGQ